MPRQGRVDSTVELKEHEKHLMRLGLEPGRLDALTALALGQPITEENDLAKYMEVQEAKIPGKLAEGLKLEDLAKITQHAVPSTNPALIEGQWSPTGEDGDWRIEYGVDSDGRPDTRKLYEAVERMMPSVDDTEATGVIPVTVLLPDQMATEAEQLADVKSSWRFMSVGARDGKLASQNEVAALSLRLISLLQAVGFAGTQVNNATDNSGFMRKLLKTAPLSETVSLIRRGSGDADGLVKLGQVTTEINRLDSRFNRGRSQPGDAELLEGYRKQRDAIEEAMWGWDQETKSSYYLAVNPDLCKALECEPEGVDYALIRFAPSPTFTTKFSKLNLTTPSSIKSNDLQVYRREIPKVRQALLYLMSMTRGAAITFYLKKRDHSREGEDLLYPALILPENWCDLVTALKQSTNESGKPLMSDADYESKNIREDYQAAIRRGYKKEPNEVLRAYIDLDNDTTGILDDLPGVTDITAFKKPDKKSDKKS